MYPEADTANNAEPPALPKDQQQGDWHDPQRAADQGLWPSARHMATKAHAVS